MSTSVSEAFNGLRIPLPNGKELVTTRPLLFLTALRWLELLDDFNRGEPYRASMKLVIDEMPEAVGVVDMSVLNDLTFGEAIDFSVHRFLAHRRSSHAITATSPSTSSTPASPA